MKAKYWYSIEKLNKTMNLNEDIFTVNQNKFGFILNKTLHKKYLNNWLWSGKLIACDKYNHTRQRQYTDRASENDSVICSITEEQND
jgi:hypothetical protein